MRLITPCDTILPDGKDYYHEVERDNDTLVIAIGDSWTWGDRLGKTTPEHDDYEHRTSHVYGAHISRKLNADFINLGFPGFDNTHILLTFNKIFSRLTHTYRKCYVFFTLTESGRELQNGFIDQQDHYNKIRGNSWPTYNSVLSQTATSESIEFARNEMIERKIDFVYHFDLIIELLKSTSLEDFFVRYEAWTFRNICQIFDQLDVDWRIARNFTSIHKENYDQISAKNLITERWVDIISQQGLLTTYPKSVRLLSKMGLDPVLKVIKTIGIKSDRQAWLDVFEQSEQAIDWLSKSPYNSQYATRHPLEQAHKWWAEYLLGTIK
jgi:hypothetical protein